MTRVQETQAIDELGLIWFRDGTRMRIHADDLPILCSALERLTGMDGAPFTSSADGRDSVTKVRLLCGGVLDIVASNIGSLTSSTRAQRRLEAEHTAMLNQEAEIFEKEAEARYPLPRAEILTQSPVEA